MDFSNPYVGGAAAAELGTARIIISPTQALEVSGRYYVAEPSPGEVGLYERSKELQAKVTLDSVGCSQSY